MPSTTAWVKEFQLEVPVDMAITMNDGIACLETDEAFLQHIKSVARNLSSDGLYLIANQTPLGNCWGDYQSATYRGVRDGLQVEIHWGENHPVVDFVTGLSQIEVIVEARYDDGKVDRFSDLASERLYTPRVVNMLMESSGHFSPLGWFGDFDFDQSLTTETIDMVEVFQKIS